MKKYFYLFWKKLGERQIRAYYKSRYAAEYDKFEKTKEKKPSGVIKREMNALRKYWGCYPFQYVRYEFYMKSCDLSLEDMKRYVPNYFAYYLFFPKIFGSYGFISEDKGLTHAIFDAYNIPQPGMLFKYQYNAFYNADNSKLSDTDIDNRIDECSEAKLFVKPIFGLGGVGILVFNKSEAGKYFTKEGEEISAAFIRSKLKDDAYIIQTGLVQHQELNNIYPHSINTFRIMTRINGKDDKVMYAMLRMGQKGNQVDNASQAGIAVKVNPETGAFDDFAYTSLRYTETIHPDTGFVFKDYVFPYWDQTKEFILKVAAKFPEMEYLGWDVAFTENGPAIIEINAGAGLEFLQDCHGGVRDAYGIVNPKKYWYHSQYTLKDLK